MEPAWTLLTSDSLRGLRQEPSAVQTATRIANDLDADEIASSAVARNTLILLRQAIERGGLLLTATRNLSRAVVAEMREIADSLFGERHFYRQGAFIRPNVDLRRLNGFD